MNSIVPQTAMDELGRSAVHFFPSFVMGVLILLCFWLAGYSAQSVLFRLAYTWDENKKIVMHLLARSAYVALFLFGLLTALGTMGINVSALVAGLGLTGFAMGFALKDALSNVLAGALILIYRPFRVRDRVSVAGLEGLVANIDLRYTTLQDQEKIYLIPNSTLFTTPIIIVQRSM